jgi:lipopolysaccharide transport system permease protein
MTAPLYRSAPRSKSIKWHGDILFLLQNLVFRDFRIRYRNMSLGVLWSLLNPLVIMGALTFVFTKIYPSPNVKSFPVFVLCGLVPFNFFTLAWISGTTSIIDNAGLLKRIPLPKEIVPLASVLSVSVHLVIQILLLLATALIFGRGPNVEWLWLPLVWGLEIVFVCGLVLLTSTINVYVRDTRYIVEAVNAIIFWLMPIFYSFDRIPARFASVYQFNPVAAVILCLRNIVLTATAPPNSTLLRLTAVSFAMFAVGLMVFRKGKRAFYDHF